MFSFLTEPNYPQAAIGFERDALTAIALEREGRGRYGVRQAATIDLPRTLLTPSFLEKNISSPEQIRVLLEDVVLSAGLMSQKNWSVSLPSNTARTVILTLENGTAAKTETEDILDWKAEQSFGAPAGELRITRQKISNDREGRSRYFATAVKMSVIDEYETIFESLGWKAGLILPRAVSETKWLMGNERRADSLLLSSQTDGFTAMLLRGDEPAVVRTVMCSTAERDDEIYRLLMFYNDRFADPNSGGMLDNLLVVGKDMLTARIKEISTEALGRALRVLRAEDVGLNVPSGSLSFDDLAAPAGLATLGWR